MGILVFSSCRKEIDLDLRSIEPILVVQAEICEGQTAEVKLSSTKAFYDINVFPPLMDAVINLTNGSGLEEKLVLGTDSIFRSKIIKGEIDETYYLKIEYNNEIYTSSSKMLPPVPIDTIIVIKPFMSGQKEPIFNLAFTDPLSKEIDYYRFLFYLNDERIMKKNNSFGSADIYDGTIISTIFMLYDENVRDNDGEVENFLKPGDKVTFEIQTINRSAYLFFSSLGSVSKSNPNSNIEGGAIGSFSAYSKNEKSIILANEYFPATK